MICRYSLVAKLAGHEQETRLQHAHGSCRRHCIEVLQLDLGDHIIVRFQGDLKDVSLLGLQQEEVHALGAMCGRADEDHATFGIIQIVSSARNGTADIVLIAEILVR